MQGSPKLFIQDANEFLSIDRAELAGRLLISCLIHADRFMPSELGSFLTHSYGDKTEIKQAAMEALAWLISECLVVPDYYPSPGGSGWLRVSGEAKKLKSQTEVNELVWIRQTLPKAMLHPLILQHAVPIFLTGKYDTAVFEAFKQVEVCIRDGSGIKSLVGTQLAREAFKPSSGILTDKSGNSSEQQAVSDLFAGAFGAFRNPSGHNNLTIPAAEAAELLVFASHLLRTVEKRVAANQASNVPATP